MLKITSINDVLFKYKLQIFFYKKFDFFWKKVEKCKKNMDKVIHGSDVKTAVIAVNFLKGRKYG